MEQVPENETKAPLKQGPKSKNQNIAHSEQGHNKPDELLQFTNDEVASLKELAKVLKEDKKQPEKQEVQKSSGTPMTGLPHTEPLKTEKATSWWEDIFSFFGSFIFNNDDNDVAYKDSSHKLISWGLIWIVIGIIFYFLFVLSGYMYDLVSAVPKENLLVFSLDKTPFVFVAVIFCATLMFIDSIIKTLKYQSRPQENIVVTIVKNVGILVLLWFLLGK